MFSIHTPACIHTRPLVVMFTVWVSRQHRCTFSLKKKLLCFGGQSVCRAVSGQQLLFSAVAFFPANIGCYTKLLQKKKLMRLFFVFGFFFKGRIDPFCLLSFLCQRSFNFCGAWNEYRTFSSLSIMLCFCFRETKCNLDKLMAPILENLLEK